MTKAMYNKDKAIETIKSSKVKSLQDQNTVTKKIKGDTINALNPSHLINSKIYSIYSVNLYFKK